MRKIPCNKGNEETKIFKHKYITIEIEDGSVFIAETSSSGAAYTAGSINSIVEAFRRYLLEQTNLEEK